LCHPSVDKYEEHMEIFILEQQEEKEIGLQIERKIRSQVRTAASQSNLVLDLLSKVQ
jgi:hypothetical protein